MTTELVLVELLCCDCVFCNSLVFYVSTFYFILWAVVSAAYSASLSSSYFERINDDDDDDDDKRWRQRKCASVVAASRLSVYKIVGLALSEAYE